MFTTTFTNHGDAHGIAEGDPIMVALSKVTTHGTPHPNDDYYPLTTTWKPVPLRVRALKNGVAADGGIVNLEGYLRSRQANRPSQSSMPTIKYVPASMQARAQASRRKPARRFNNKNKNKNKNPNKKIQSVNRGVNGPTFGKKKVELMSVGQLEHELLKELNCTVLPIALEDVKKANKGQKGKKERAARIRKAINKAVSEIVSALDPYTLANMASRGLFKDRNQNAHFKTGLKKIIGQLLELKEQKEQVSKWKKRNDQLFDTCLGCQNLHYTHTCDRKRRVAHCCMVIKTKRDPDAQNVHQESDFNTAPDDENENGRCKSSASVGANPPNQP